jgi:CYTH domain-containing protein
MTEIERKFILEKFPNYEYKAKIQIIQFYICSENDKIIRVRKIGDKYNIGFKKGKGMSRTEIEIDIDEQNFQNLSKLEMKNKIKKNRYLFELENYTAEIDVFEDNLKGLIIAEVEFKNKKLAENFVPPEWFGKEVTNDYRYTNSHLSKTQKIPS